MDLSQKLTQKLAEVAKKKQEEVPPVSSKENSANRQAKLASDREAEKTHWYNRQVQEFVSLPADYQVNWEVFTKTAVSLSRHPLFDKAGKQAIHRAVKDNPRRFNDRHVRDYINRTGEIAFGEIFLDALFALKPEADKTAVIHFSLGALHAAAAIVDAQNQGSPDWNQAKKNVKGLATFILETFDVPEWLSQILISVESSGRLRPVEEEVGKEPFEFRRLWNRPQVGISKEVVNRQEAIERVQTLLSSATETSKTEVKLIRGPKVPSQAKKIWLQQKQERNKKTANPPKPGQNGIRGFAALDGMQFGDVKLVVPQATNGAVHA